MGIVLTAGPASATTTFAVDTTADQAPANGAITTCSSTASQCSLRAAVTAADNTSGPVTIDVPAGTYSLTLSPTEGPLNVGTAPGAQISIDGTGTVDISQVQAGTCTSADPSTCNGVFSLDPNLTGDVAVTLSGLTISGGVAGSADFPGGAAVIAGSPQGGDSTTLAGDTFSGNQVFGSASNTPGGAVSQLDGSLTVTNCIFTSNSAGSSSGGAIDYEAYDPAANGVDNVLGVSGSTFTSNSSANVSGGGGALFLASTVGATYEVTASTFTANQATAGAGVADGGGAILQAGGTLTARSDNFATNGAGSSGSGGAINVTAGTAGLVANRFVDNTAATGSALGVLVANSPVVSAGDNWWADNSGPTPAMVSGLTVPTWLELRLSANPTAVATGGISTLTADLTHDQADNPVTPDVPDGIAVTFAGTLGTTSPTSATTASGQATSAWTAGGTGGIGTNDASATVDGVTASATIAVSSPPTITSADSTTFSVGAAGSFTVTTTGFPTPALTESGPLPTGVTFVDNGDGTATLAGTAGGRYGRQLPDHHHRGQRGVPGRDPELHPDRGPGPGHHQSRHHDVHGGHRRVVHGHHDGLPDPGPHRDRPAAHRGHLRRQR